MRIIGIEQLRTRVPPARRSAFFGYLLAVGSVAVAIVTRLAIDPLVGDTQPFAFFYPAIVLTAWVGGIRPACLATTLGFLVGDYFFVEPRIGLIPTESGDFVAVAAYLFVSSAIVAGQQLVRLEADGRLRDLRSLIDINRDLPRRAEWTELLPKLCQVLRKLVGSDGATLVLREDDNVRYVAEDAIAPLWAGQSFPIGSCISGWSILKQETAVVEDVYADERISLEAYEPTFVRSLTMVPMERDGKFVGAMGAYWAQPRKATKREIALLEAFIETASAAIANSRAFHDAQSARAEAQATAETLRRVQRIADSVVGDSPLNDLLNEVLTRTQETLEADIALLMLRHDGDDWLRLSAVTGATDAEIGSLVPSGEGFCGLLAKKASAMAWNNVEPEQLMLPVLRRMGVRAVAGVPLISDGRLVGVLQVGSMLPRQFGHNEMTLLQLASGRIALGIERSERRESEGREREALYALNRTKDEFLAMLGHELRNPLSAVQNALATASFDEKRRPRALEIAHRQADQLGRLIDDLLDVARITQGRITLHKEQITLADIVERAVEATRSSIDARGIKLVVALGPGSPQVAADPVRLEQVFVNLLTNAAKCTDTGGRIGVSSETHGEEIAVRVRDNGIGIAPQMLSRIWELFIQGPRALDRAAGGLGIGLTVAKRLVELHGGRLEAHSDGIGKGAEFVVTLPVSKSSAQLAPRAVAAPSQRQPSARVLLVEDHPDTAETLTMLLEVLGHHVRWVSDGSAALEAVVGDPPEVMIIDIGLPGIDGYEVARRVRRDGDLKHVLLVALTGYGSEEDKRRALDAGFDYHLVKPVTPEALHGLVARLGTNKSETITIH